MHWRCEGVRRERTDTPSWKPGSLTPELPARLPTHQPWIRKLHNDFFRKTFGFVVVDILSRNEAALVNESKQVIRGPCPTEQLPSQGGTGTLLMSSIWSCVHTAV